MAEITAGGLHRSPVITGGRFQNFGHLGPDRSIWKFIQGLFNNAHGLFNFIHAHHVACHGITFLIDRHLKIKLGIDGIRLIFSHVIVNARSPGHRPGAAIPPGLLPGENADACNPFFENNVMGHQIMVEPGQPRPQSFNKGIGSGNERIINIVVHAAETKIAISEPRAGDPLQQIQNLFPVVKGIEQWRKTTQIEKKSGPPEQVAGQTVQLHGYDPDILGPFRHLDAGGPLNGQTVAMIIGQGMQVIHAGGIGHELGKGAVFGHLFMHAVDIAEHRFRLDDILSVHGQFDPKDTMGGGMLGAEIKNKGLVGAALHRLIHGVKSFSKG